MADGYLFHRDTYEHIDTYQPSSVSWDAGYDGSVVPMDLLTEQHQKVGCCFVRSRRYCMHQKMNKTIFHTFDFDHSYF
jgi:hypothetical protein